MLNNSAIFAGDLAAITKKVSIEINYGVNEAMSSTRAQLYKFLFRRYISALLHQRSSRARQVAAVRV